MIHHAGDEEKSPNYVTTRGDNDIRRKKQLILASHYWVKYLCPLLGIDKTAKCDQLVTRRVDRSDIRVTRTVDLNESNRIEEPQWSDTRSILISIDT